MAQDNEYCLGAVPAKGRKGVLSLMLVMLGLTFFSASMWTGGALGTGLVFDDFIKAVLIGNLLLGIYTACLGYIGASTGLSTHLLARYSFGVKGSWLPSLLLGGTQVGWFGVGVAMFALPVQKATGIDVNWLIAISGMLMTVTVYFGISALMVLSFVAVPAIALLGGYSVWLAVTSTGSMAALQQVQPSNPIEFTTALTMVAFFLGNTLMFVFGAAGAAVTGQADISEVMLMQGLLIPAILVLGLNIWTTNDNALYASGLGFANITGLKSKPLSVINGLIGTACALWLYNNFVGWLAFLSTAIPPIGGIIIMDFLLNRERYRQFSDQQFETVRWQALVATAVGVAVGKWLPGIVPLNAVLGAAFTYFILVRLTQRPVLVQEANKC
ncbi:cytosine permease [Aeromonas veronii]|uniref:cytosine permease n=1 Tax=Aeromonas veronii TaxID=654 RepID=UPI003D22927D